MQSLLIMTLLRKRARSLDGFCWIWKGAKGTHGIMRIKGKTFNVHRVAAMLWLLDFDENLLVRHKCSNKLCFNPEHLEMGTKSDNALDTVRDCIHHNAIKTHCKRGHEFTLDNIYLDKNNSRKCKKCKDMLRKNWEKRNDNYWLLRNLKL